MTTAARSRDEGMTLVETLVGMLVLGISLTALAALMVGNVRSVAHSQATAAATAASLELVETMQSLDWGAALLYANDTTAAGDDRDRWRARLAPDGRFEGHDLATIPGPAGPADRDPAVPLPSSVHVVDGTSFAIDLYPTWVDRSGDGAPDTKRFVVVASWVDPVVGPRELRTEAERAPTQDEAVATSGGARFLHASASPTPVHTDDEGELDGHVDLRARTNVGLVGPVTATLRWRAPVVDDDGVLTGWVEASEIVTLDGDDHVAGQGHVTFDGRFKGHRSSEAGGGEHLFPNGVVDVELAGTSHLGRPVVGATSFVVASSPWQDDGGTAAEGEESAAEGESGEETSEHGGETEGGATYDDPPRIQTVTVGDICVSSNKWRLTAPLTFRITVRDVAPQVGDDPADAGYVPADGTVTVTYPYWTKKNGNATSPDGVDAIAATFSSGSQHSSVWDTAIPANDGALFKPATSIAFDVTVTRPSDGGNDATTTSTQLVRTC